jgi:hypothetical protein
MLRLGRDSVNAAMNLTDLERAAYRRYHADGLWDIGMGLFFAGPAVAIQLSLQPALHVLLPLWFAPCAVFLLRDPVRHRHLGRYKPGAARRRRRAQLTAWVIVGVVMVVATLATFAALGRSWDAEAALTSWAVGVLLFGGIAHFDDCPRLWLYGFPLGFGLATTWVPFFGTHPLVPALIMATCGAVAVVAGATLFARFRRLYPVPQFPGGVVVYQNPGGGPPEPDRLTHDPALREIMADLCVVEDADTVYLLQLSGARWSDLAARLSVLEAAGIASVARGTGRRRPRTRVALTDTGRTAFLASRP